LRFLLTCNPGLEDLAWTEAREEANGAASLVMERRGRGRIIVEPARAEDFMRAVWRMRSIHSAVMLVAEGRIGKGRSGLEEAYRVVMESGVHRFLPFGASFAVRAERIGEGHEYTSMDVARVAGDAVIAAYEREYGLRPEVRLDAPGVAVYVEVDDDVLRVGVLLAGERSLHRRGYRVYDHPAALKPTLAYALLRLAGARDSSTIVDPMCGGGTVAIEAARLFEDARIVCVDKTPRHIEGARMNAAAAGVASRVEFYVGDARRLHEILGEESIDYVASNPPYGIRLGDPKAVRSLYSRFIPSLARALRPGGRAALVTTESRHASRVAEQAGLRLAHARKVRHGDLWVSLLVFEKP